MNRSMLASIVVDVVYGMRITGMDAEYVRTAEAALRAASASRTPGTLWVEYAPFLRHLPRWMPGTTGINIAKQSRPVIQRARDYGFDFVKADKVSIAVIFR